MAVSSSRRLPATVVLLGLTSLFTDAAGELVFSLLPMFLLTLGAGPLFLGVLEGLADATSALLKYLSGAAADRFGRKKPLVLFGYGLAGLVRPLVALATAPWHVLLVRVSDRVGKGVRSAPRDVLISNSVDGSSAGRAFGFHSAMDHVGAVVGPLAGAAMLASGWTLQQAFLTTAVPGVLAVICVVLVKEQRSEPSPPTSPGALKARLPPRLTSLLGIFMLFALGNSSDAFLLVRARELGNAAPMLPLLWALLHVSKVAWTWVGGTWADRVPRHRLIFAGWAVYASSYLLFAAATAAWHAWALFVVYGAFYGLTEPVEKAMIKELAPGAIQGRAFGLYHGLLGAAAVPAGLLAGGLWQGIGAPAALGTGAAIAGVSALLLARWSRSAVAAGPA